MLYCSIPEYLTKNSLSLNNYRRGRNESSWKIIALLERRYLPLSSSCRSVVLIIIVSPNLESVHHEDNCAKLERVNECRAKKEH